MRDAKVSAGLFGNIITDSNTANTRSAIGILEQINIYGQLAVFISYHFPLKRLNDAQAFLTSVILYPSFRNCAAASVATAPPRLCPVITIS